MKSFYRYSLILETHDKFFPEMLKGDITSFLVFADWLEENDKEDLAAAIRLAFDPKVGEVKPRRNLFGLFQKEMKKLFELGYRFTTSNLHRVIVPPKIEPNIANEIELVVPEPHRAIPLVGHPHITDDIPVAPNARPTEIILEMHVDGVYAVLHHGHQKINPNLIKSPNTYEALILQYLTQIMPMVYRNMKNFEHEPAKKIGEVKDSQVTRRLRRALDTFFAQEGFPIEENEGFVQLRQEFENIKIGDKLPNDLVIQRQVVRLVYMLDELENHIYDDEDNDDLAKVFAHIRAVIMNGINLNHIVLLASEIADNGGGDTEEVFGSIISAALEKMGHHKASRVFSEVVEDRRVFTFSVYRTGEEEHENEDGEYEWRNTETETEINEQPMTLANIVGHLREFHGDSEKRDISNPEKFNVNTDYVDNDFDEEDGNGNQITRTANVGLVGMLIDSVTGWIVYRVVRGGI